MAMRSPLVLVMRRAGRGRQLRPEMAQRGPERADAEVRGRRREGDQAEGDRAVDGVRDQRGETEGRDGPDTAPQALPARGTVVAGAGGEQRRPTAPHRNNSAAPVPGKPWVRISVALVITLSAV